MALPITNLKLHCDASDNNSLYKTFVSGVGPGGGHPVDGDDVNGWEDQGDGVSDVALRKEASIAPKYKSSVPLMRLSCLYFAGLSGSCNMFPENQLGTSNKTDSNFFAVGARTIAIVFYPESITDTSAAPYNNEQLIAANGGSFGVGWGIGLKDSSGVKKLRFWHRQSSGLDIANIDGTIAENRTWIAILKHESGNLKLTIIADDRTEENPIDVASGDNAEDTTSQIGGSGTGPYFEGRIGEFAYYNAALTGSDLTDLKNYFMDKWLAAAGGASVIPFGFVVDAKRMRY